MSCGFGHNTSQSKHGRLLRNHLEAKATTIVRPRSVRTSKFEPVGGEGRRAFPRGLLLGSGRAFLDCETLRQVYSSCRGRGCALQKPMPMMMMMMDDDDDDEGEGCH